ncbi:MULTISPECIES: SOS response-associated peptidase family protein [unclassified Sphingobacterium]|uniref:SOS response-associated peptidase family protein n=1 Tax=unclassified Sphingobacterium TaxID=2609468 RepID=UPI0025F9C5F6|nr:SOS response-associated peptidase family protein [Sphingobacterium sp. UBA5670]
MKGWKKKVPYFIGAEGREPLYLPGLYERHKTVDEDDVAERVGSFGMLTQAANEVMANIHNEGPNKHRMPLFLPEDLERQWIDDIQEEDMPPNISPVTYIQ